MSAIRHPPHGTRVVPGFPPQVPVAGPRPRALGAHPPAASVLGECAGARSPCASVLGECAGARSPCAHALRVSAAPQPLRGPPVPGPTRGLLRPWKRRADRGWSGALPWCPGSVGRCPASRLCTGPGARTRPGAPRSPRGSPRLTVPWWLRASPPGPTAARPPWTGPTAVRIPGRAADAPDRDRHEHSLPALQADPRKLPEAPPRARNVLLILHFVDQKHPLGAVSQPSSSSYV